MIVDTVTVIGILGNPVMVALSDQVLTIGKCGRDDARERELPYVFLSI